jgi:hypothetical protein
MAALPERERLEPLQGDLAATPAMTGADNRHARRQARPQFPDRHMSRFHQCLPALNDLSHS